MSDIVNIIPNLETRQRVQIIPTIKDYANTLRLSEGASFDTKYLNNLKKQLNISLLFNGMVNEVINGKEEHTRGPAEDLINSISNQFGIMSSSNSHINTENISPIPNPNPPAYSGSASTLISVIEDKTNEDIPTVVITWETESNFTGYKLYRNNVLLTEIIETYTDNYRDTTISRGITYSYTIACIDEDFGEIAKSDPMTIMLDTIYLPATITGTYEEAQLVIPARVVLVWESTGTEVTAYKVYKDGIFYRTLDSDVFRFVDEDIFPNTTYEYALTVIYSDGTESSNSNIVSINIPASSITELYAPRLDSAVIVGSLLELNWSSNGNVTDVLHDISVDDKIYYGVSGSRSVSSDTVWTETYSFIPDDFVLADPHYITIRATLGTEVSEFSNQVQLNIAGVTGDIYTFVEETLTGNISDLGLQLPSDYILDIGTEYHGTRTDISKVAVSISSLGMTIEPYLYVQTVSSINDYRFDNPLNVSAYNDPDNSMITISITYYNQDDQVIVYNSVNVKILAPSEIPSTGIFTKTLLENEDYTISLWGTDVNDVALFSIFTINSYTSTVVRIGDQLDYKIIVPDNVYYGPTIAENTLVTIEDPEYSLYVEHDQVSAQTITVYGKEDIIALLYPGAEISFVGDSLNIKYTIDSVLISVNTHPDDHSYLIYGLNLTAVYTGDILYENSGVKLYNT